MAIENTPFSIACFKQFVNGQFWSRVPLRVFTASQPTNREWTSGSPTAAERFGCTCSRPTQLFLSNGNKFHFSRDPLGTSQNGDFWPVPVGATAVRAFYVRVTTSASLEFWRAEPESAALLRAMLLEHDCHAHVRTSGAVRTDDVHVHLAAGAR